MRGNNLLVRKVAESEMLGSEIDILRSAVDGISVFCTINRLESSKANSISLNMTPYLFPNLIICREQIYGRNQYTVTCIQFVNNLLEASLMILIDKINSGYFRIFCAFS